MTRILSLAALADLYAARGGEMYGEAVTQADHAGQCAALAVERGASPALVAAALLHDFGHLLCADHIDVGHAAIGAAALATLFSPEICAPIALHVAAKRYLCAVEPGYRARLSPASQASLVVQGGALTPAAAAAFARGTHAEAVIALRRFDDDGKRSDGPSPTFTDYLPLLAGLLKVDQRP